LVQIDLKAVITTLPEAHGSHVVAVVIANPSRNGYLLFH
jgi:hypothetical protein